MENSDTNKSFSVTVKFIKENITYGCGITNKQLELLGKTRGRCKSGWMYDLEDEEFKLTNEDKNKFIDYGPHGTTDSRTNRYKKAKPQRKDNSLKMINKSVKSLLDKNSSKDDNNKQYLIDHYDKLFCKSLTHTYDLKLMMLRIKKGELLLVDKKDLKGFLK